MMRVRRRLLLAGAIGTALPAAAQGEELYPGEKALHDLARHEGLVVALNAAGGTAPWGEIAAAFRRRYPDIDVVANELGSTATVAALERARARPVADTAYFHAAAAAEAARRGLSAGYVPANHERLPAGFADPDGAWTAVHAHALAFIVNPRRLRAVPQSWEDLLRPEYRNAIVYLDPRSTGAGQLLCFAAAFAAGGSLENVAPGMSYLGWLHKAGNVLRVVAQAPVESFRRGEIPIWIGYEHEGLRLKRAFGAEAVAVVMPREASVAEPYATSLVRGGPNPNAARLWLNFLMSLAGQTAFAAGDLRPAVPGLELPAEIRAEMPEAPQIRALDVLRAAARKSEIDALWTRLAAG